MVNHYLDSKWIGMKYGKLTVIEPVHVVLNNGGKQWFWRVRCDCGNEKIVKPNDLISKKTVSCGCYKLYEKECPTKTHGESHTRLHDIWCGMNKRCNSDHKCSARYGGRGIKVCDEWKDYVVFADWARNNGYDDSLTIERIDVNGDYAPDNCKWIPLREQARNRRTTRWVEYGGKRMSLAEACEIARMPYKQVFERIVKHHWSVADALGKPIRSELGRQQGK